MVSLLKKLTLYGSLFLFAGCCHEVNLGHRMGGDVHKHLPENSLSCLEESLMGSLHHHKKFVYVEFDVRETKDHQIVVCHDRSLKRMVKRGNSKVYIDQMTLKQIQTKEFKKSNGECIPTLDEFFAHAIACKIQKPVVVEIKYIKTGQGMANMIQSIEKYLNEYGTNADIVYVPTFDLPKVPVNIMCFSWNVPKKLLDPEWKEELRRIGIHGVYEAMNHSNRLVTN